ncbi:extracellular solute-binding protein family 3 [Desulfatibacillum aliphaticivorans]|uniref:Extracellular solute-binding protein family 3 n=1 Tax=Desulfatibacillum aliphaticivorans TaxID=218208 RepID=B8FKD2_DESAL|nr:transporter substrate-binding domain-containing protein [Desulfatibacillum aliphaticivorans]ACL01747.1 extracellular solute-binding protein family 3 [Desulfatibacillum aliphaticivorans]
MLKSNCFVIVAVLIYTFLSAGFSHSSSAQAFQPSQPLTVKAAVLKNFPPHYTTDANGKPSGFAVDVLERVTQIANIQVEYIVKEDWQDVFEALKSGEADLIPDQGITERRKQWFDYSLSTEACPIGIFVLSETEGVESLDDLIGKKTAVVALNVGEAIIAKRSAIKPIVFDNVEAALLSLLSGNVDALIFPEPVIMMFAREARVDRRIKRAGSPLRTVKRGIAVRKGNITLLNRLNPAIEQFLQSKEYSRIYTKWHGEPTPFWNTFRVILAMLGFLSLTAVIMGYWRYRSMAVLNIELKKQIRLREAAEQDLKASYDTLEQKVEERTRKLKAALSEVKALSGLLPICSHCKKIRDDQGYWKQIESYIQEHSEAEFSHSICRDCAAKHYPELKIYEIMDAEDNESSD